MVKLQKKKIMRTKKYLKIIAGLSLLLGFVSCDKFLDIEPQQEVDDFTVYTNHENVVNALNGAYSLIAGPELYAGSSVFHSDVVANSGDLSWLGTFIGYKQMNWKSMDPNEATITAKWVTAYKAINVTNNVLAHLDLVNEDKRETVEGEAKFLRGILYFELVRFYALPYVKGAANDQPGVPLMLSPVIAISDITYPSRVSVADIYTQIVTDLTDAKQLLAEYVIPNDNKGKATVSSAAAFLARVYMAMEEWDLAANESDLVIQNFGGYTALNSTPRAAFNNDGYTPEDVFMIRQNATSNAGESNDGVATFFASLPGLGRGDVMINESHFAIYGENDLRGAITDNPDAERIADIPGMFYYGVGTNGGNINCSKWGKHDAYIAVIRLAEMILTRAEANFRNGSAIGANPLDDINAIRNRAQAGEWTEVDLAKIGEERYRELCFEGHALHDMRRFRGSTVGQSGSPYAGETIQWNDPRLVLPIPQREIDVNSNLEQNSAYAQ